MKKIFAVMLSCILVSFCMTGCVNIPTGIPDSSSVSQEDAPTTTSRTTSTTTSLTTTTTTTTSVTTTTTSTAVTASQNTVEAMVWIPQSGKKYHSNASCSNMKDPSQVSKSYAVNAGYEPCKRCYK